MIARALDGARRGNLGEPRPPHQHASHPSCSSQAALGQARPLRALARLRLSALLILQFPLPGKEYLMNCSCQESCPCRPLAAQSLALVIAFMSVCAHPCCRQTDRPTISSWTDCQLRCATAIYLMACNAAHVVIPSRSLCHRRSWRAPIHAGWLGHQHTAQRGSPQQAPAGMICSKTAVY